MAKLAKLSSQSWPSKLGRAASLDAADSSGPLPAWLSDPARLSQFRRRLRAWFAANQRDLPWRQSRDPYRVWVSEIMLQQTQVATVVPYFARFVAAFPDARSLAAAPEEAVLRLWEGLGYYRRARQLHRAAQLIVERHGGEFPCQLSAVRDLPGIGRYTAGAITSIAFDTPAPILEANTARLFARLVGFDGVVASSGGQRVLWSVAEALTPARGAGEVNQALMELGSLICTPREPDCPRCPVAAHCAARLAGRQRELPRAAVKVAFTAVREAALVVWRGDRVFLRQRQPGERWAGLWDFPRFELSESPVDTGHETKPTDAACGEVVVRARELTGLTIQGVRHFTTLKHGVTRFRITLDCFAGESRRGAAKAGVREHSRWLRVDELPDLPLSTTGRKIARLIGGDSPPT